MFATITPESLTIALLSGLAFFGLVRFFSRGKGTRPVNWTPLEAVGITILLYFAAQIVAGLVIVSGAKLLGMNSNQLVNELDSSAGLQFLFIATTELLTIGALAWFMKWRRTPWKNIGWVRPRLRDIGYALAGFGIYFISYGIIIFQLIKHFAPQIDTDQAQQLGFSTDTVGPMLLLVFVSLAVLPPLVEEILVRGFLFTGLRTKLPVITAALLTSLVFGVAHLQLGSGAPPLWTAAIDTFVLSLVLVWLRNKTGSLWPGIGVHFAKNGIAFIALFIFKIT